MSAGFVHRHGIHLIRECINITAVERTDNVLPPDVILVCLGSRGTASVKIQPDFFYLPDSNSGRKKRIGASQDGVCVDGSNCFHVGNLSLSMHPCIGPSGSGDIDGMIEEFLESFL